MKEPVRSPANISIKTHQLGKRFNREWIFRKLTRTFEPGQTYAITGPNGSGKSTLLQILWGQSIPSSGQIAYVKGDAPIADDEIFRYISIATPYMDLIDEFTLEEQVAFHFKFKKSRAGMGTEEMMERMYLTASKGKQIVNFSSGMKQRLKLGLAFFTESSVLFLDEPGTNLDQQAFSWFIDELGQIPQETLIFIASNNPDEYKTATEILNIRDFK